MSDQTGPTGTDGHDQQDHGQGAEPETGSVGSGAMESTPALTAPIAHHEPESLIEALEDEPTEVAPISLGQRLTQPRTILSIVVPLAIIGFFLYLNRERLAAVPQLILQANPALVLLAAIVFYLGFPLRGYRWKRLLRETGFIIGLRNSIEILYISWFVNCVVPAKLGDVYRAYLLKMNSDASLSRTLRDGLHRADPRHLRDRDPRPRGRLLELPRRDAAGDPGRVRRRHRGRRGRRGRAVHDAQLRAADPRSGCRCRRAILELYDRFEEGVFGAVGLRHLPILAFLTGLIWLTEGLRLYIVVQAFGFPDVELGLSGAIFVALIGSLLTAIPLSPAGLGFAQAGVIGVLTVAYGVPLAEATAITILDWVISVLSIIVFGAVAVRRLADAARDGPHLAATGAAVGARAGLSRESPLRRPIGAIRSDAAGRTKVRGPLSHGVHDQTCDATAPDLSRRLLRTARRDRYQRVIQASARPADS